MKNQCLINNKIFRRMYSDRKKPSLSSAASSIVLSNRLPIHGSKNTLPATSHSANELSDTSNSLQVPIHTKSLGSEPPTSSSSDSFHTAPSIRLQPPEDAKFQKNPEMDSMA
uniref:Uncharacterized protein n=1 Tax=Bursaphelenchus xylophilus TaxID=6326 RepID=A0A1I7SRU4_BURXY